MRYTDIPKLRKFAAEMLTDQFGQQPIYNSAAEYTYDQNNKARSDLWRIWQQYLQQHPEYKQTPEDAKAFQVHDSSIDPKLQTKPTLPTQQPTQPIATPNQLPKTAGFWGTSTGRQARDFFRMTPTESNPSMAYASNTKAKKGEWHVGV